MLNAKYKDYIIIIISPSSWLLGHFCLSPCMPNLLLRHSNGTGRIRQKKTEEVELIPWDD